MVGALLIILIVGHPPVGPAGQRLEADNNTIGHHERFLYVLFGTFPPPRFVVPLCCPRVFVVFFRLPLSVLSSQNKKIDKTYVFRCFH